MSESTCIGRFMRSPALWRCVFWCGIGIGSLLVAIFSPSAPIVMLRLGWPWRRRGRGMRHRLMLLVLGTRIAGMWLTWSIVVVASVIDLPRLAQKALGGNRERDAVG